ncbi:hypothetical protein Acsp05_17630 [Actinokineospora sp. NBRC 105648]|nr:hypothetical protein Acsp05_17630 [Actinokineospora sp. NBRC 105648]
MRTWCAAADPPIELIEAGPDLAAVWTGPGAQAAVVILDLHLNAGHAEFGALRRLVDVGRRVVVYTQAADPETATHCVDLGALAYVTKREGGAHLVAAIQHAADGRPYTPPWLGGALAADTDLGRPKLTPMEVATLRAWFASSSKRLAAAMLRISPKTIETYLDRVRTKYANVGRQAPTKSALVARALEDGWITLDELDG